MIVKDCILEASRYLGDDEVASIIKKIENNKDLSQKEEEKYRNYLGAFNVATATIVVEELGLTSVEKLTSDENSKIDYDAFDERVYEVLKVVDKKLDRVVDYYSLPFALYVPNKNREYLVRYKYLPKKVDSLDGEVLISPLVVPSVLAKLMVSDLLLARGSYEEASIWKSEYRRSLSFALSKRAVKLPPRPLL